jgi:ABC-2 type transport system ATP-binding protein
MTDVAVRTQGLTKRIGRRTVLDGIDLTVPAGSVFGLLGPEGAGKSTLIRVLLGLTRAGDGTVELLGARTARRRRRALSRIGATVGAPAFNPQLSVAANLARLDAADRSAPRGTRRGRIAEALHRTGLLEQANRPARQLSPGQHQRLALAAALTAPRELLLLDQATDGLDEPTAARLRTVFADLARSGTTVVLASTRLAELEPVCTHLALLRGGRLLAQAPIDRLGTPGPAQLRVETPDAADAAPLLSRLGLGEPRLGPDTVTCAYFPGLGETSGDGLDAEDVVAVLVNAGIRVRGLAIHRETLADRVRALLLDEAPPPHEPGPEAGGAR